MQSISDLQFMILQSLGMLLVIFGAPRRDIPSQLHELHRKNNEHIF